MWVYKINTNVINKYNFISICVSKKEIKKIINADKIEDSDEYLVIKAIIIHDRQKINPSLKDKAKTIPKYVATPLPPLNFNQIGNICPRRAIRPDKKIKSGK